MGEHQAQEGSVGQEERQDLLPNCKRNHGLREAERERSRFESAFENGSD